MKSWFIGKDPDAGKDWEQDEKGAEEDETAGWHHWLNDMSLSKLKDLVKDRDVWCAAGHGVTELDTTKQLHKNNYVPQIYDHLPYFTSIC